MIRHEQRLHVSTVWEPVRTVRYTRRVVTETRMIPVRIRREILQVEDVDVPADESRDPDGPVGNSGAADLEIVLHEEVPVVSLEIRAVEIIRIAVRSVASTVDVTEELSSEQVAVEDGVPVSWVPEESVGSQVQPAGTAAPVDRQSATGR